MIKFKTSSPAGDLMSMLPGIKKLCEDKNKRAIIYQRLDVAGIGYEGAIHPFKNEIGDEVMMNEYMLNMLKPLLESQDYIEKFETYTGQEYDIDLDKVRMQVFTNQPLGSINRWIFYVYPQMTCDLSESWIKKEELPHYLALFEFSDKLIINFTFRYRNTIIDYNFLKKYQDKVVFVGLKEEKDFFCKQWGLEIDHIETNNFRELAALFATAKGFLGNQSFCYQLAEGLKIPRILELSPVIPNVVPTGENAYDFYHQQAVEYYVDKVLNNQI
jgi:hypothetical protein